MRKWISWALGALLLAVFFYNTGSYIFGDGPEIGFFTVISLVIGATLFVTASDKSYNASVDQIRRLDGVGNITIQRFYEKLSALDTPLGTPWLGGLTTTRRPCIIWGPNANGEYIYAFKMLFSGSLYIAYNDMPGFLRASKDDMWRLNRERPDLPADDYRELICYKLDLATMVDDLRDRCVFIKNGRPLPPMPHYKRGALYRLDEEFRFTGQNFSLCDIEGESVYKIKGAIPLKTIRIFDANTDAELLRMTKRILHLMPHYDFYMGEEKLGRFRRTLDLMHERYVMNTPSGVIEMRRVNATIGDNFQVRQNGRIIGTIAEKLNLTLKNIVFDNFVIHARDESDTLLLTALAVMAARGKVRRRSRDINATD